MEIDRAPAFRARAREGGCRHQIVFGMSEKFARGDFA
jgi:hypothetical protein